MSFILDALRKSETEHQKAQVPGIGDAPMVVHQKHVPRWTIGLIACLSGCLVVLGWFWLRDAGTGSNRELSGVAASTSQSATNVADAPPASPTATVPPSTAGTSTAAGMPTASGFPTAPGEVIASGGSIASGTPTASATPTAQGSRPVGEVRDLSTEARQGTVAPSPTGAEIATDPAAAQVATQVATPATPELLSAPLPTIAQYRASGGALPELNLELHVYSATQAERFVFINASKYVEGQTLAEGPRLGAITEDGAVLVHQGRSLLLPRH